MGYVVHRLRVLLPKHHQNEILRVGDTQLIQHRRIGLGDESCCRIETEAYLLVESQFFVHNFSLFTLHFLLFTFHFYNMASMSFSKSLGSVVGA